MATMAGGNLGGVGDELTITNKNFAGLTWRQQILFGLEPPATQELSGAHHAEQLLLDEHELDCQFGRVALAHDGHVDGLHLIWLQSLALLLILLGDFGLALNLLVEVLWRGE
jgi:hypothetical protein